MMTYVLRRILQWLPVLLVSSILVFAVVRALPGDAADVIAGPDASEEVVEAVRQAYGLDQPLPVQYFAWLGQLAQGNMGSSYTYHMDAGPLILSRVPNSLLLAGLALGLAVLIGVPTGLVAGLRNGKWPDWLASGGTAVAIALPDFWFGMLVILLFSVTLGWLPPGGLESLFSNPSGFLPSLVLPTVTLALTGTAVLARFTRSAVIETMGEDYVRTARAKGLKPFRVTMRHILRNSLVPVITMMGILFGRMLGGAVVIESLFAWPGVGRLLVQSIINRDYSIVQGVLVLLVLFFLAINLIVDLLYAAVDPRIRYAMEDNR